MSAAWVRMFLRVRPLWGDTLAVERAAEWMRRGLLTPGEAARLVFTPPHERRATVPPWTLMRRLISAVSRWMRAGFPVPPIATLMRRRWICGRCSDWKPAARWGAGRCAHPGCGCTRAKWWMATERCPAGKW